jgi:tetratricopeptide (TPR) repeat protein
MEPDNSEANYQAAALLMWKQRYQRSLEHIAKLDAKARSQIGAEALICADEAGLGNKEATDRAAALMAANTDLTEEEVGLVLPALRAAHRADLLEKICRAADARQPLSVSGLRMLGLAQEAEGRLEQARATLERVFAADISAVSPLVDLARIALTSKDYQGALGYLAHARELQPTDPSLPYEFGVICLKLNLLGEARKAMAEAVQLAPENPEYNLGMGTLSSLAQDASSALPYLEKYHQLRPSDATGTLALGTTYFRVKDFDAASAWLKQAANDPRTAASAQYYLGRISRQIGKLDEAIGHLLQSAALKPDQPEVLAELGGVYVQMRKYAAAERQLDLAIKMDPGSYSANFALLQLYARTGDSRREGQAKRFDAIKDKDEEQYRETMRVIEIRSQGDPKGNALK